MVALATITAHDPDLRVLVAQSVTSSAAVTTASASMPWWR